MAASEPILAVDDSAPIREMIATILSPRGYRVATAHDGREALQRLKVAAEPYMVLLDVVMPLLDGVGLCQEIEQDDELRRAGHKIILMSSAMRLSAPDIPVTAGQLVKPFTRRQLIEAIEAVRQHR
ncbi:MAG TPA: response regulator [Ktedonobacterales bacterium]|jgi:OmpR family response regulator RpaB|nr:response regulator [Ktedonobacterales bacterium]